MTHRIQFESCLGPEGWVFETEEAAEAFGMENWPEGGWWVISEE